MAMKPSLKSAHHWSVELGKSYKTIQGWLAGKTPDSLVKRGKSDQQLWYLTSVLDASPAAHMPEGEYLDELLNPEQQRARKDKEGADKLEMENAVRRGELAEIDAVVADWVDMVAAARAKLLSLPTKLGPQLVNIPDVGIIADRIRLEVYSALADLARYEGAPEGDLEDRGGMGAAAVADGEPVGRQAANTQ